MPGLAVAVAGACLAAVLDGRWNGSKTLVALGLGCLVANAVGSRDHIVRPGFRFAARRLLRLGVVLVGFKISTSDLLDLGWRGIAVAVVVVLSGFAASTAFGRSLGVRPDVSRLIGAGSAICGASAIAAVAATQEADEHDTAACIALITMCGSVSMLLLPVIARSLGWSDGFAGPWLGLSIHDVGQVVAASSSIGDAVLRDAVVTKLARVALLVPVVVVLGSVRASRAPTRAPTRAAPVLPAFVVLFVAAVASHSIGIVPDAVAHRLADLSTAVLLVAFVGLGGDMKLARLRLLGPRPVGVAAATSVTLSVIAGIAVAWWH